MSNTEQQEEEREVLQSIYDGDNAFIQKSETSFQYKVGQDGEMKSFILEVTWGTTYPEELPEISMDVFYNNHIVDEVKSHIVLKLTEEAEQLVGCPMTFSLFSYVSENSSDLTEKQPLTVQSHHSEKGPTKEAAQKSVKQAKEQLTKAQKRKLGSRLDNRGELPRGYDWVDVIKHLSQAGKQQNQQIASS